MFLELNGQRTGSGFGPNPLQFSELLAWQQMTSRRLVPWETRAVLAMDRAYMVVSAELAKPAEDQVSEENLSAEVFDRMFGSG